jgi:DNA adenine methylase
MSGSHQQRRRGKAVFTGGKNPAGVYQRIINLIPPHRLYFEPFVGSGAILLRKRPARWSIACDTDPSTIAALRRRAANIPHLELLVADGTELLEKMASPSAFIYADPPYVRSTRRDPSRDYYRHEWTDEDHAKFLAALGRLTCKVMVSGYPSALYDTYLSPRAGWRRVAFPVRTRGGPAVEVLWMNYPEPAELHDYRYIGGSYEERWRIHKRQRSWWRMLRRMPELERRAMLTTTIDEFRGEVLEYLEIDVCFLRLPDTLPSPGGPSTGGTR